LLIAVNVATGRNNFTPVLAEVGQGGQHFTSRMGKIDASELLKGQSKFLKSVGGS
jgi:hypothetical protein